MNIINQSFLDRVGNTPLIKIIIDDIPINLYAKLEYYNPTGSVKDRAANYIIKECFKNNIINKKTTIIESSSGNFGISLSAYCKKNGVQFICVIDPHISPINEMIIKSLGAQTIKVKEPDKFGGYLLNRIAKVKELTNEITNSYWVNQYSNPLNAQAYYHTLGNEICSEINEEINYVFLGVSSGGTITGVSQRVKEQYPKAKIIAVDIWGSVIFGNTPHKRYIPGIGSSMIPDILKSACIDDVVMIDELETIEYCKKLLRNYSVFVGGSSGSVFAAINKYFKKEKLKSNLNVVTIFPDRGERYCNTIYSEEWCNKFIMNPKGEKKWLFNIT
jgi:N-(2-amino-2-carboxyethyl)-L-glutamate synthase